MQLYEKEQLLFDFGNAIARDPHNIPQEIYDGLKSNFTDEQIVTIIAFAGLMCATNLFNTVAKVDLDEVLYEYRIDNKEEWLIMKTFDGKVAFITGAAHGQGRATALALAKEGAAIAAFDVATKIEYPAYAYGTGEELKSLKSEIEAMGEKC